MRNPLHRQDLHKVGWVGLEPNPTHTGNYSTKQQSAQSQVQEFAQVRELPPDLQQIIDHWDTLPTEIKQTILTLVKHSRKT